VIVGDVKLSLPDAHTLGPVQSLNPLRLDHGAVKRDLADGTIAVIRPSFAAAYVGHVENITFAIKDD
jgi:hypothetical protein